MLFNEPKVKHSAVFALANTPNIMRERAWLENNIAKGSRRMFMEEVKITPSLAELMLERNKKNRTCSERIVQRYAADMQSGNWLKTSQSISFSDDGQLNDGQHRLWAVIRAGCVVNMAVVFGEPRDAFTVIDTGKKRTAGDVLSIAGNRNANVIAAGVPILIRIERGKYSQGGAMVTVSHSEILEFIEKNPDIEDMGKYAQSLCRKIKIKSGAALAAYFLLSASMHNHKLPEFWRLLSDGEGLDKRNPVYHLRERIITGRFADTIKSKNASLRSVIFVASIINTWNKWLSGRAVTSVYAWKPGSPFPFVQ